MNRLNYQKSERKVKLNEAYFTREASLDMVVRIHNDKFTGEEYTFIVSSFGLPPICRALTADRRTCYHSVLALELDMKMPGEGTRWDRKSLLECFVETRGPGSLKISARLAKLVKDLDEGLRQQLAATKKPLGTFDELLNRSSTYQSRGLQQLELKNAYRAHTIFQEGLGYMQWLMDCQHGHSIYPINSTIPSPLSNKCWELGKASVLCCMDIGDRNSARSITKSLFKCDHSFTCRSQVTQAEAYYYLGLVHVADGAENAPANSFLHALLLKPGYGEADEAVDEMRERVINGISFKHIIVQYNIDNVLKPFRHQTQDQIPLGDTETKKIIGGFVGNIRELDREYEENDYSFMSKTMAQAGF